MADGVPVERIKTDSGQYRTPTRRPRWIQAKNLPRTKPSRDTGSHRGFLSPDIEAEIPCGTQQFF
jgi:hypothetical protein